MAAAGTIDGLSIGRAVYLDQTLLGWPVLPLHVSNQPDRRTAVELDDMDANGHRERVIAPFPVDLHYKFRQRSPLPRGDIAEGFPRNRIEPNADAPIPDHDTVN
jgi:hypothetical protein